MDTEKHIYQKFYVDTIGEFSPTGCYLVIVASERVWLRGRC